MTVNSKTVNPIVSCVIPGSEESTSVKLLFAHPSVRPSLRLSVRPSVRLSARLTDLPQY